MPINEEEYFNILTECWNDARKSTIDRIGEENWKKLIRKFIIMWGDDEPSSPEEAVMMNEIKRESLDADQ